MKKYEILIGKANRRGQGDYIVEYSFDTLEEVGEKFKDVVNYEKKNTTCKKLKRNEHTELLLQESIYGEKDELLSFEVIDVVSIRKQVK